MAYQPTRPTPKTTQNNINIITDYPPPPFFSGNRLIEVIYANDINTLFSENIATSAKINFKISENDLFLSTGTERIFIREYQKRRKQIICSVL